MIPFNVKKRFTPVNGKTFFYLENGPRAAQWSFYNARMNPSPAIELLSSQWDAYALIDSGNRKKLERFGPHWVVRGEPKAWWKPTLDAGQWAKAVAVHDDDRGWKFSANAPRSWQMQWNGISFEAKLLEGSKHLGIFPEQSPHWEWIAKLGAKQPRGEKKALNLFGYTGAATLAAAKAGFAATHVDASRPAVTWARANQERSGMSQEPIRWILDDALKFMRREVRRGTRYDLIMMDPPSFGRGPNGEVWKVEVQFPELLELCRQCLSDKPVGVAMTLYSLEASSLMLGNLMRETMRAHDGKITAGELALAPQSGENLLPLSLWSRWEA